MKKLFLIMVFALMFVNTISAQNINGNRFIRFDIGMSDERSNYRWSYTNSTFIETEFRLPVFSFFDISTIMLFKYKKGKELIYWSDWHYPSITHKDWEDIYVNHLNLGIQLHFYYDINSNFIPFLNIGYIHRYSDNKSAFKYFRNDPVVIGQSGLEVNFDSTYTISSYLSLLRVFDPWNYEQYEINVLFIYWLSDQIGFKTQLFHNITYNLNGARLGIIYNL